MFFNKKNISVDFTLSDISGYYSKLREAVDCAFKLYNQMLEMSTQILEALDKIIDIGNENLQECILELDACDQAIKHAQDKINALMNAEQYIQKVLFNLNEAISKQNENYLRAQSTLSTEQYRNVSNEAEARARQSRIAVAQGSLAHEQQLLSRLREKHSKLYNMKGDVASAKEKLQKSYDTLVADQMHLEHEKDKIEVALDNAEDLIGRINNCTQKLQNALYSYIDCDLSSCMNATSFALAYANEALQAMGSLNGVNYSDYDHVTVTNLGELQNSCLDLIENIKAEAEYLKKIYGICDNYEGMLEDNIMSFSISLLRDTAYEKKRTFEYLSSKSMQLESFCGCLVNYSKQKM